MRFIITSVESLNDDFEEEGVTLPTKGKEDETDTKIVLPPHKCFKKECRQKVMKRRKTKPIVKAATLSALLKKFQVIWRTWIT